MAMGMDKSCDTTAFNAVSYTLDIILSSSPLVIKADNFASKKDPLLDVLPMRAGHKMAQSKDVTATVFSIDARVSCMFTEHYVRPGYLSRRCASNEARCRRCNVRLRVTTNSSSGCTKCKDVRRQIKVTVVCW